MPWFTFLVARPKCATNVRMESANCTSITFTWTAPTATPISYYKVTVCPANLNQSCVSSTTNMTRFTAADLFPSTDYSIKVDSVANFPSGNCVSQTCPANTGFRSVPQGTL